MQEPPAPARPKQNDDDGPTGRSEWLRDASTIDEARRRAPWARAMVRLEAGGFLLFETHDDASAFLRARRKQREGPPTRMCEISWADAEGNFTPDDNPAVCRVRIKTGEPRFFGGPCKVPESRWLLCCADHALRLSEPGMHIWECEPL